EEEQREQLLAQQQELEDTLAFERARREQEVFDREVDIRKRRQEARAKELERLRVLEEEDRKELEQLEAERVAKQRLADLQRRRDQLTHSPTPMPPHSPTPMPQRPSVGNPVNILNPDTFATRTIPNPNIADPRNISFSIPGARPLNVPIVSSVERAYRHGEEALEPMNRDQFAKALRQFEKSLTTSKGHVFKGSPDVQR
ncbi:hypothetical protein HDV00_001426, partial [Rhizophlyctis rosea]